MAPTSTSHFLGSGNDFAIAGQGLDAVFGDAGDDWEEGGDMPDLLIGDSSTFFFDDHNVPGNDVLIGQGGDDDYDGEGGDDIVRRRPRHREERRRGRLRLADRPGRPAAAVPDLDLTIVADGATLLEVRDQFNEVEALSGWNLNDHLLGDDVVPADVGGGGFIGCDALDQDGLDRITGLDRSVPPLATDSRRRRSSATDDSLLPRSSAATCGAMATSSSAAAVATPIEGRGADDIIDGDKYLERAAQRPHRREQPGDADRHHRPSMNEGIAANRVRQRSVPAPRT